MKALLFSDTRNDGDRTCNVPDIIAIGDTADAQSIIEAFSDDLALVMEEWDNCTFHLWGTDKEDVDGSEISFAEVVEKFLSNECGEISVDTPDTCRCPSYSLNWAIRDIPGAKYALVKSGMEANGNLSVPSIQYSGSEEYCNAKMEEIRERSGEELEGDDGHWWYKGTEGEVVCYDIVEI